MDAKPHHHRPNRPLLWLIGLAVAVHAVLLMHVEVAARDSIGFIRFALQLEGTIPVYHPVPERLAGVRSVLPEAPRRWLDTVATSEQPPGYPLAIWLVSVPVRHWHPGPLADAMAFSARLASAIAAVLLVVPMYLLGRRLFGSTAGFCAAALFQCLPVVAEITSDGLSEATFLLAFATTLWLNVELVRRPSLALGLLAGLGSAAAYMTRPEGVVLALAAGVVLLLWSAGRRLAVLPGLAGVAAGFLVLAGPYMLTIAGFTNKPTGQGLLDPNKAIPTAEVRAGSGGPPLAMILAGYMKEHGKDRPTSRGLWSARTLASEWFKSSHYVIGLFGALGVLLLRSRIWGRPELTVVLLAAGLNIGLLWYLGVRAGYLSERHTLPLTLVTCLLAGSALPWWGRWLATHRWTAGSLRGSAWTGLALFVLLATGLPVMTKTLHVNRGGFRAAGEWLAEHAVPVDSIHDPFCWAHYYSGAVFREGRPVEPPVPPRSPYVYIVLEESENSHPRLPSLPWARAEAAKGTAVFTWKDPSRPKRSVVVYQVKLPGLAY